jgi:hypothetical protein
MSPRNGRILFRIVGIVTILLALFGLLYNASSFYAVASGALDDLVTQSSQPYLLQAFYVMSSICVAFYVLLLICGIQFLRQSASLLWLFVGVVLAEIAFHLVVRSLWHHSTLSLSIAGATGISSGGLVPQAFLLFPLWAPIAVWFARRSQAHRAP